MAFDIIRNILRKLAFLYIFNSNFERLDVNLNFSIEYVEHRDDKVSKLHTVNDIEVSSLYQLYKGS